MVKEIDSETVISTLPQQEHIQPSLKRWLKHTFYFKSSKKLFNDEQKQQIADVVTEAEHGHRGEIKIIIEGSLPSHLAFEINMQQRAERLFSEYRVWDTQYNSGILIYLNLCEHAVEIVADRGIHQAVSEGCWDNICQSMLPYFKKAQYTEGLCVAVERIGALLEKYFDHDHRDPYGNELPNEPRLI